MVAISGLTCQALAWLPIAAFSAQGALETAATDRGDAADDAETVEEIVVLAPNRFGRRQLAPSLEDPVRLRVLEDLAVLRQDLAEADLIETTAARFTLATPRIRLGYDPTADFLRRSDIDIDKPQRETTDAATLIRIGF